MVTMILGGLWHGASFNFVIWGSIHGTYLCIEKIFYKNRCEFNSSEKGYSQKILRIIFVQFLVFLTWIFFRSESLNDSIRIIQKLLNLGGYKLGELSIIQQKFHILNGIILTGGVCLCEILSKKVNLEVLVQRKPMIGIFFLTFFWLLIIFCGSFGNDGFIYL